MATISACVCSVHAKQARGIPRATNSITHTGLRINGKTLPRTLFVNDKPCGNRLQILRLQLMAFRLFHFNRSSHVVVIYSARDVYSNEIFVFLQNFMWSSTVLQDYRFVFKTNGWLTLSLRSVDNKETSNYWYITRMNFHFKPISAYWITFFFL